ncbi:hypothetical protein Q7P37_008861 [Cladosporium fusiforme]
MPSPSQVADAVSQGSIHAVDTTTLSRKSSISGRGEMSGPKHQEPNGILIPAVSSAGAKRASHCSNRSAGSSASEACPGKVVRRLRWCSLASGLNTRIIVLYTCKLCTLRKSPLETRHLQIPMPGKSSPFAAALGMTLGQLIRCRKGNPCINRSHSHRSARKSGQEAGGTVVPDRAFPPKRHAFQPSGLWGRPQTGVVSCTESLSFAAPLRLALTDGDCRLQAIYPS